VQELIGKLKDHFVVHVEVLEGIEENVHFRLPAELAGSGPATTANRTLQ
jgi:hypothetical protein